MNRQLLGRGVVIAGTVLVALGTALRSDSPHLPQRSDIRTRAVELCRAYVPCDKGDAVFDEICRDYGDIGTTCGYLPSWLIWRLGAKASRLVNRTDSVRGFTYRVGKNIATIRWQPEFRLYISGMQPEPGDVFFVSDGPPESEHVGIVLDVEGDVWTCAEGGQRNQENQQCMRIVKRRLANGKLGRVDGIGTARAIVGWLDIEAAVNAQA